MQYQLDLQNYRCPLPVLMAKRAMQGLNLGEQLLLLLNKMSNVQDFELLCEQYGYQLERLDTEGCQQTRLLMSKSK